MPIIAIVAIAVLFLVFGLMAAAGLVPNSDSMNINIDR